jgi:hypothetical protein
MIFNWLNLLPQGSKNGNRLARRARVGTASRSRLDRSTTSVLEQLEERLALANDLMIVAGGAINTPAALIQAQSAGDFSFGNTGTFTIDPGAFTGAGAITLQANNDVTISNAISDGNANDSLTIQAGRSITDNASITYATALNLTANTHLTAVGAGTSGTAGFTMGAGATILSSTSIDITLDSGIGINPTGNVSIATLSAPAVTIADQGPTAGSSIVDPSGGGIISPTVTLSAINGTVGQNTKPLNLTTATVTAQAASGIFLFGGASLTLGNITSNSGQVDVAAVGSITVNGTITDKDGSDNGVVTLNSAASGTTPGNITFGASGDVAGYNETFIAGDGDTATSVVDFANASLQGPTGAGSSPTFFTDQQDASIADAPLSSAQFGNGVPLHYALTSQQGSVAVATAADVANSDLVLTSNAAAGDGGIDIGAGTAATFTLTSLSANASAGNSIQLDSAAAGPQITTTGTVGPTANGMMFNGALSLSQNTTLNADHGGGVDFASASDHNVGNENSLAVTAGGAVTVGGGGFFTLQDFTITAAAIDLNGSVVVDGSQTYNGPVLLGVDVVLVNSGTTFNGTVDSAPGSSQFDLTINSNGPVAFAGNIGANNAINRLTLSLDRPVVFTGATLVDTIGDQSYTGPVTLGNDLALISSSGSVGFGSTVDSSAGKTFSLTVAASTGTASFGGAVGDTDPLSQLIVTAATIALGGGSVQSQGDQVYNGAVSLGAATDLNTAQSAVINFNGTLDGGNALTIGNVNAAGEVIFGGGVGSSIALTSLAVTATRILINGTSVVTSGAAGQTYSGNVFLGGTSPVTLSTSAAGNPVTFNGDLTLGGSYSTATDTLTVTGTLAFNNTSGTSTLYSTFNSQGSGNGAQAFGQINATSADLTGVNLSLTFATAPMIGGNSYAIVQGSGSTSFLNVTADDATKFYVSGVDFTAGDSTSNLVLTPTAPTDAPLTVGTGGTFSTIQAAIDASVSGDVIEIDDTANPYAGFTTNNGTSNVSLLFDLVGGGNIQINSAVTLTADTAFELSGTGLTFSGSNATINGDVNLTFVASTAENLDIQATVGAGTPLNSFTTGAGLTTQLAANITTNANSGGQAYYGNVQLQTSLTGHLATLTAKTATFNGSVGDGIANGGKDTLSIVGNAVFSGAVNKVGGLTVSGETLLNNGGVKTSTANGANGDQTYSGAVILGSASATLTVPGLLSLAATNGVVGNGNPLTINGTGTALTLNGSQIDDVGALNVTDDTGLALGGDLVTGGTQSFSSTDGIGLNSSTTLTAVSAAGTFQTIALDNTVDAAAQSLTINGNANFGGNVTVSSLNVGGTTAFQTTGAATTVTTTQGQTFLGAVSNTGGADALNLTDSGSGVLFGSTLANNSDDLTITGNATFNGTVTNIANFHVTGTATFANGATSVDAAGGTGNLTIDGAITLANIAGALLTLDSAGLTTLRVVAGGGNDLTIDGDNGVTFAGVVSNVDNLSANVVNHVAIIVDTAAITTNGTQTYSSAVQLGTSADLTGSAVSLDGGALDGNAAGTDSLTITGDATIGGSIGGNAPASLTVVGATTINPAAAGTAITFDTVGDQAYEGGFTIGTNVSMLGLTTAPTVTLDGPITGNGIELDVQSSAVFNGVVNDVGALNIFGAAAIDGGIVNSTGTQTYNGAVDLGQPAGSLFTNTALTATGAASSVVLSGAIGVGGTSRSLSVFADDNVNFGGAVGLAASGGTLNAVADTTGLNAAGSGNGQIFVSGGVNTFGGSVLLAGSAFHDTAAINAGTGTIDLAPSVAATVGVGAGAANFQVTNAQLAGLTAGLLAIGGVDATSVTVSGADATASGVTGLVYLVSGPLNASSSPAGEILFTSSASQFGATADTGLACATNGAISVSAAVSAGAAITLTAGTNVTVAAGISNTGAHDIDVTAGANVTISTGATVESGAGTVTLNVGAANAGSSSLIEGAVSGTSVLVQGGGGNDDLTLNYAQGASLPDGLTFNGGGGTNTLTVADAGAAGAHTYAISGSGVARDGGPLIALTSVQSVLVTGGNGNDVFNVTPSATTTFTLNGGANGAAGDQLNYLAQNLPVRVVPGKFTANFLADVIFVNFAKLNLDNAAGVNAIAGPDTADRSTAFTGLTADETFIQALYLDDLGRAGSKAELDSWLPAFNSRGSTAVASGIQASQEARDHLVRSWYLTYLGRAANGVEEQSWVNLLATESEEQVLSAFLSVSGREFFNRAQTLISSGTADERYVEALYLVLLDRSPSAAELQYWINVLPQVGLQGIALGFLHSTEFRTDLFESYYNALLDRPSDAPGLNYLVTSALNMAQVRVAFGGSPEFFTDG